ncbi:hypothetical protein MKQ70_30680 [Chitinophaga sedimenti]|uniref:hypothetical protein n=1 Tax=Chitinophaga sedimenti TaxID=2033606 RepID=UPI00200548D6|nr:hypothetical protein [Chitinophaga sedimenti]MCK7559105.1 hypothetical protein [Chitinophaga sedimenti]
MRYLSGILLLWLVYSACTSEQAPKPGASVVACDTAHITSGRMYTLIQQHCTNFNCHPGGGAPARANFGTLASLKTFINNNRSLFADKVTGPTADMPQSQGFPALSREVRDSIACWINNGMPDQ